MRASRLLVATFAGLVLGGCRRDPGLVSAGPPDPERQRVLLFWQQFGAATSARIAGDCSRAEALYIEALRLDPRHEDSLYYLGQCQRSTGQPSEARQAFARLVQVNPASARGHLALGALLASPDPEEPLDLSTAESHLRRAHAINAEETGPMLRLAEVLIVWDRAPEARTWLEAATRTNPKSVESAFLLGYLLWRDGDRAGAEHHLAGALRAARGDAPPKGVLGEGDRKPPVAVGSGGAAPPLREPMGRTLFGDLAGPLRDADPPDRKDALDALYRRVDAACRALATRAAKGDGTRPS